MLLLSKLLILMTLLKYCPRSLCCSWKYLRILQRPVLLLDVSIPQGPELHLDLSSLQWPALQLDMDCGGLCCIYSRRVYTTGVWASNVNDIETKAQTLWYRSLLSERKKNKSKAELRCVYSTGTNDTYVRFALLLLFLETKRYFRFAWFTV